MSSNSSTLLAGNAGGRPSRPAARSLPFGYADMVNPRPAASRGWVAGFVAALWGDTRLVAERPFDILPDGVRLRVRLTPRSGRDGADGVVQLPDGRWTLRLRLAAPPMDGAANAAVLTLLAARLGVARSRMGVATGHTSRLKTIEIAGEPAELTAKLTRWIAARQP